MGEITRLGVLLAVEEFDQLGRSAFLEKYGFQQAANYFVLIDDRRYDSKPIVAAARMLEHPDEPAVGPADFSGGIASVGRRLESLGFVLVYVEDGCHPLADDGDEIDATFDVEGWGQHWTLTFHSSGGTKGSPSAINLGYAFGLRALLKRLADADATVQLAELASRTTRHLPPAERAIELRYPLLLGSSTDVEELASAIQRNLARLGKLNPASKGGNGMKRVRIAFELPAEMTGRDVVHLLSGSASASNAFQKWLERVATTPRSSAEGSPSNHQPATLRWFMERAVGGEQRMVAWQTARGPLASALEQAGGAPNPQYPLIALARSRVLEQEGLAEPLPAAHGSIGGLLNEANPSFGLPSIIEAELRNNPASRAILESTLTTGASPSPAEAGTDWSAHEVEVTVDSYLEMLIAEASRTPYSKAERRRALEPLLPGRSKKAIEFKHQNISAVMIELGLPYIRGYRPADNYQGLLLEEVERRVAVDPSLLDRLTPPAPMRVPVPPARVPVPNPLKRKRAPRQVDYDAVHQEQSRVGRKGEEEVVKLERARLIDLGKPELAERVRWVARDDGDGAGYDVQSFHEDGSDIYIEVKATTSGDQTPFYLSAGELDFARDHTGQYQLHRLYDLDGMPEFYVLEGDVPAQLELEPITYRARLAE